MFSSYQFIQAFLIGGKGNTPLGRERHI